MTRRTGGWILILTAAVAAPVPVWADDPLISVEATFAPPSLGPGEAGRLTVDIDIPEGWYLWSLDPGEGPAPLRIRRDRVAPLELVGPWHGPSPAVAYNDGFRRDLGRYVDGVRLQRRARIDSSAPVGTSTLTLLLTGQLCTDEFCVYQKEQVRVPFLVTAEASAEVPAPPPLAGGALSEADADAPAVSAATDQATQAIDRVRQGGLLAFLAIAFLAGLGALATPCVFPVLPLTVSFFSKYAQEGTRRVLGLAGAYALTMMACFTSGGVLISVFFRATGLQELAAHPVFNGALALLLVFFALNLFGAFELRAPQIVLRASVGLQRRSSAKGAGTAADYLLVVAGGIGATTVFFTCTVGFVGFVLVAASRGDWLWPTLGMLAFSAAFAMPFFVLALFPHVGQKAAGKSGAWLLVTRRVLGFVELAAAAKFVSNVDLVLGTNVVTRSAVLAFWAVLAVVCTGYVLLRHRDPSRPSGSLRIAVRALTAVVLLATSAYLARASWTGARLAGWVDAWLPPTAMPTAQGTVVMGERAWLQDLQAARRQARRRNILLLLNYTGYACANCRYMESAVFTRKDVGALLEDLVLVAQYTDGLGPEHMQHREEQLRRFGTLVLPFYALEAPDGRVLATFNGSTNQPKDFVDFLRRGLAAH